MSKTRTILVTHNICNVKCVRKHIWRSFVCDYKSNLPRLTQVANFLIFFSNLCQWTDLYSRRWIMWEDSWNTFWTNCITRTAKVGCDYGASALVVHIDWQTKTPTRLTCADIMIGCYISQSNYTVQSYARVLWMFVIFPDISRRGCVRTNCLCLLWKNGMSWITKQLYPLMCHKTQTLCTAASLGSIAKKGIGLAFVKLFCCICF